MTGPRRVLIVGVNVAGVQAAERLRALGYDGSLTLLDADADAPYNRPPLSKEFLAGEVDEDDIKLLSDGDLDALDASIWRGVQARGLDVHRRIVDTSNGDLHYDALLISTGATAVVPDAWSGFRGVHGLRTLADAREIRDALTTGTPRVVVVGGGLIGCEVASSARKLGLDVTLVEADTRLLGRLLPDALAAPVARMHLDRGVHLLCDATVRQLHGTGAATGAGVTPDTGGTVSGVELVDGRVLPADLVVVGIGARPNTQWLASSGLALRDGVLTDAALRAAPGVFAAGDVARVRPLVDHDGDRAEHWTNARQHGSLAAAAILDRLDENAAEVPPYVWSDQYDRRLQVFGTAFGDRMHTLSSEDDGQYVTLVGAAGRVVGAVGFGARGFAKAKKFVSASTDWSDVAPPGSEVTA